MMMKEITLLAEVLDSILKSTIHLFSMGSFIFPFFLGIASAEIIRKFQKQQQIKITIEVYKHAIEKLTKQIRNQRSALYSFRKELLKSGSYSSQNLIFKKIHLDLNSVDISSSQTYDHLVVNSTIKAGFVNNLNNLYGRLSYLKALDQNLLNSYSELISVASSHQDSWNSSIQDYHSLYERVIKIDGIKLNPDFKTWNTIHARCFKPEETLGISYFKENLIQPIYEELYQIQSSNPNHLFLTDLFSKIQNLEIELMKLEAWKIQSFEKIGKIANSLSENEKRLTEFNRNLSNLSPKFFLKIT